MGLDPKIRVSKNESGNIVIQNLTLDFGVNGNPARSEIEALYSIFLISEDGSLDEQKTDFDPQDDLVEWCPTVDGIYKVQMDLGEDCQVFTEIVCIGKVDECIAAAKNNFMGCDCDIEEMDTYLRMKAMRECIDDFMVLGIYDKAACLLKNLNTMCEIHMEKCATC